MTLVSRATTHTTYDAAHPPVARIEPGAVVVFDTHDARSGALLERPLGEPFRLPLPTPGAGNPVTGPVYVEGARPGDALLVDIVSITCGPVGWCGGHAHAGAVPTGRVPEPVGRTCRVTATGVEFGSGIVLPLRPMIGCIGTAPLVPLGTHAAGPHGGNLDHPVVGAGTSVLLPVTVEGALLSIGDVHALQGDGELSGVALEVPASVEVRVQLVAGAAPRWPWVQTPDVIGVMTVADTFELATAIAVEETLTLLEETLALTPGDALALVSIAGSVRAGGTWGGPQVTARVELPRSLGAMPLGLARSDRDRRRPQPPHVVPRPRRRAVRQEALASKLVKLAQSAGWRTPRASTSTPTTRVRSSTGRPPRRRTESSSSASRRGRPGSGCPTRSSPTTSPAPGQARRLGVGRPQEPDCVRPAGALRPRLGLRGLKLGPAYQHFDPTDRTLWPLFARCAAPRHPDHLAPGRRPSRAGRGCASSTPLAARGPRDGVPGPCG